MAEPRSSKHYAVRKVADGTWAVQKKAIPGFRLTSSSLKPTAAPAPLRTARDARGESEAGS